MVPSDTHERLQAVLALVIVRLGLPRKGDDLAIRLGWARDRGAGLGRRARSWVDERKTPPRQFVDLMHMLGEAGLLQPEAEEAWRGISPEEARQVVDAARSQALAAEAKRLAEQQAHLEDEQKSA